MAIHFAAGGNNQFLHRAKVSVQQNFQNTQILGFKDFWVSYRYAISQEQFLLKVDDKFVAIKRLFKSPLSFFSDHDVNDVNRYIYRLLKGFSEAHQKATLSLPLRKSMFDLEVDEEAFERYVAGRNEEDRKAAVSSNYQREYAVNYLQKAFQTHGSEDEFLNETSVDVSFSLIHFKKV